MCRLAVALQREGIRSGERVAVLCPNTAEMLEAHFGVPWSGAVLVAVNTRLMADEIAYILGHSGARLLIAEPSLAHLAEEAFARAFQKATGESKVRDELARGRSVREVFAEYGIL